MRTFTVRPNPDRTRVWQWFSFQREMLNEAQSHVEAASRAPALRSNEQRSYQRQFVGHTVGEVAAFFNAQLAELELLVMLELVATVEAALRLDFNDRVERKLKDAVSRKFRAIAKVRSNIRLDEEILETWKADGGVNVGHFRGALNLRHWLAHGRHWSPRLGPGL